MTVEWIKVHLVLPVLFLGNLSVARGKLFVSYDNYLSFAV